LDFIVSYEHTISKPPPEKQDVTLEPAPSLPSVTETTPALPSVPPPAENTIQDDDESSTQEMEAIPGQEQQQAASDVVQDINEPSGSYPSSSDMMALLEDICDEDEVDDTSTAVPQRRLPDWMRDPKQVAAEQQRILQEQRIKKEAFRHEAMREWSVTPSPTDDDEMEVSIAGWVELSDPPRKGRMICFDLETTGFSKEDSIIEIAAVELIDGFRSGVLFQSYAKPRKWIHPMAFAAHQISDKMLQHAPPIQIALISFLEWVGTSPLVAHNLAFDLRMLRQEMERLGFVMQNAHEVFCTMKYFRRLFPSRQYSLDAVSITFGVNQVVHRKLHGALVDSEILAQIYGHLVRVTNKS